MDDFYFEEELRRREEAKARRRVDDFWVAFPMGDQMSSITEAVYEDFDEVLGFCFEKKYGGHIKHKDYKRLREAFEAKLTDDSLAKAYEEHEFTEEELDYIKLTAVKDIWRGRRINSGGSMYAINEILIRQMMIDEFGAENLRQYSEEFAEKPYSFRNIDQIKYYFKRLFASDKPFGTGNRERLEEHIATETDYWTNYAINCGGYALKIDECVFPQGQRDFGATVSVLLDKFPFIRLLGDEPLQDDEYLVMYRAKDGSGHHFVRVDSDGVIREKHECHEPQIFENWGSLEDCPEAVFAVKKDHPMFDYDYRYVNDRPRGLNFEESVAKAVSQRQNEFAYHGRTYSLKKNAAGDPIVVNASGEMVAEMLTDDDFTMTEVVSGKEDEVENLSGGIRPIIRNGVLVNHDEYKGRQRTDGARDDGEDR